MSSPAQIIAVMVGNTNTLFGMYDLEKPQQVRGGARRVANGDLAVLADAITSLDDEAAIVLATVNEPVSEALVAALERITGRRVFRMGVDVGIAMDHRLDPDTRTGQDRFLAACGAYQLFQQACVVVDAGTAVTVDFVDGTGVFQGGAIAPGARMSLLALSRGTAALPDIELRAPLEDPFGRNSVQAILNGVFYGVRGLVRTLTERYAEAYEAYPLVVATGGDAELLFSGDELIERIVPDLALIGIAVSAARALREGEDDDES
ncbi:MAG: type III pantothenate kinase [Phycisphaerales bacterium]|nr:type III pantothenate kinase [Phycisphaerales bacterium]